MTQLTETYRPKRIADFAGLARAKAIMSAFVRNPHSDAFLWHGASGTGKTTLALAVAGELNAQVIHVPSSDCSVDKVRWLREVTACVPMFGRYYVVIVDEADRMTPAAQIAFLSLLDATGFPKEKVTAYLTGSAESGRKMSEYVRKVLSGELTEQDAVRYIKKDYKLVDNLNKEKRVSFENDNNNNNKTTKNDNRR